MTHKSRNIDKKNAFVGQHIFTLFFRQEYSSVMELALHVVDRSKALRSKERRCALKEQWRSRNGYGLNYLSFRPFRSSTK
jgi:hypothetical protein